MEKLKAREIKLQEFKDFARLPWEQAPKVEHIAGVVSLTLPGESIFFKMEDFHRVLGYGGLQWRNVFHWLTRYIDRSRSIAKALEKHLKECEGQSHPFIPKELRWEFDRVSDLVAELREVSTFFPNLSTKGPGEKIYFTELAEDSASSSRFEYVWGATYIQALPERDPVLRGIQPAIGTGDKTVLADGRVVFDKK